MSEKDIDPQETIEWLENYLLNQKIAMVIGVARHIQIIAIAVI